MEADKEEAEEAEEEAIVDAVWNVKMGLLKIVKNDTTDIHTMSRHPAIIYNHKLSLSKYIMLGSFCYRHGLGCNHFLKV